MSTPTSKKVFVFFAFVFVIMLAYVSYDISRRTTFPGSKPQLIERLKTAPRDTVRKDTVTKTSEE